ncbi:hypothetical protein TraAM80_09955, partial [Trypanosoma rangeli]
PWLALGLRRHLQPQLSPFAAFPSRVSAACVFLRVPSLMLCSSPSLRCVAAGTHTHTATLPTVHLHTAGHVDDSFVVGAGGAVRVPRHSMDACPLPVCGRVAGGVGVVFLCTSAICSAKCHRDEPVNFTVSG